MIFVQRYMIRVICGCLICSILITLSCADWVKKVMRMLCGIFLSFTILQPILRLQLPQELPLYANWLEEGSRAAAQGEQASKDALQVIIKEQTEAYILSKAQAAGAQLLPEVQLSDAEIPIPISVHLTGAASRSEKAELETILEKEFGIPKECQFWTLED